MLSDLSCMNMVSSSLNNASSPFLSYKSSSHCDERFNDCLFVDANIPGYVQEIEYDLKFTIGYISSPYLS